MAEGATRHAGNPACEEYTLCGVAWDCNHMDTCADEPDVFFAESGQTINCADCRKVIAYCKAVKRWKEPGR